MWKTKTALILITLFFSFGLARANQSYLPKADLVKGTGPEVYILEKTVRRWIADPETFEHFQYKWTNIKNISDIALAAYPQGRDLDWYDDYPDGSLLRGSGPGVYLIELGQRRWFPNPEIFEGNGFGWKYILDIDDDRLNRIDRGDNITLSEPNRYPETIILEGPEKESILENSEITFKYSGINPLGEARDLSFETYLAGYDTGWQNQSSNYTVTYDLSEESKVYTFYVRAKNEEGYLDPSPASLTFQTGLSPYYKKIEISWLEPSEEDFKDDYLVLRNNDQETINISQWILKTDKETMTIPQAIAKLRYPFSRDDYSDIKLASGDEMIIFMGVSPKGVNFRTNKCTGYFDQDSQFCPSLDKDCPYLEESKYSHLSGVCRNFIDGLSRCQIPDYSEEPEVGKDSQCTKFLNEKFNYQQCYEDYYREIDFFGQKWLIFLNKSIDVLGNNNDRISLRDKNGLLVDRYSY